MDRYLIVTDIDGTLLRSDGTISKETKNKIKQLTAQGHIFALATGRMHGAARMIAHQLGWNGYIISCNGAVVKHSKTGHELFTQQIPRQSLYDLLEIFERHQCYYHLYASDLIATPKMEKYALNYYRQVQELPVALKFDVQEVGDMRAAIAQRDFYKVGIEHVAGTHDLLADEVRNVPHLISYKSYHSTLDIMFEGITKVCGIQVLMKYYEIPPSRVIAFGDQDNDRDMLTFAAYGMAMGNATQSLKEAADAVVKTNDEDGLRHALTEIIG